MGLGNILDTHFIIRRMKNLLFPFLLEILQYDVAILGIPCRTLVSILMSLGVKSGSFIIARCQSDNGKGKTGTKDWENSVEKQQTIFIAECRAKRTSPEILMVDEVRSSSKWR